MAAALSPEEQNITSIYRQYVEWIREQIQHVARDHMPDFTRYCSFCAKSSAEVAKLIAGPSVFICNECIGLCNDIMAEEKAAGG